MDTEPRPRPRAQLQILSSSGNPWAGTEVRINGKIYTSDNKGIVDIMGLVEKRINCLWINGKKADIGIWTIRQGTSLVFQNCTLTRSSVYQIFEIIE